ncbi:MAG: DUF2177 family protein [Methyloligellaceae bacterium]
MIYLTAYIATTVAFLVFDFVWLAFIAKKFYRTQLGSLMKEKVNFLIAGGFYAVFTIGIVYFAVAPALETQEWQLAMINGALFGFFTYATYDLTNMATIRDWPAKMSIVDMAWGTSLTSATATMGYLTTRALIS